MSIAAIDVPARRKFGELLRHLGAGRISNDQMEDAMPKSKERAIREIFWNGVWPLYDDLHEHKLTGPYRLAGDTRETFARAQLFLTTDLPYRWPHTCSWRIVYTLPVAILTFGFIRLDSWRFERCGGVLSVWPFFTATEYEQILHEQPFLTGLPKTDSLEILPTL
jgi:hypothetical protein